MKTLVAVASRHGSTREIAAAIADELRTHAIEADLREAGAVAELAGYDAVVLGSAVYAGNWQPEARRFVEMHRAALAGIPVWLFSSGPIGTRAPNPRDVPRGITALIQATHARGHRVFGGRLEPGSLNFVERLIFRIVRVAPGDYRSWEEIRGWARDIAASLAAVPA